MAPLTARGRAYLLLTASMALVGSYVALSKPLLAALPVLTLALLRFALAAVALAPWTARAPDEPPLTRGQHLQLFLMAFFGNFLFTLAMLNGVARTTATAAGVILATLPAVVALLSWLLLAERPTRRALAAVALAVAGIALLQFARAPAGAGGGATWLGNALMLVAVGCEAGYVILSRRLAAALRPLRVSALINLWGLALTAPLALWQIAGGGEVFARMSAGLWALLVFYALAASFVAVWLWMTGMQRLRASEAGVFTVALPISATAIGVLLLGEHFSLLHLAALAAAAGGVLLIASAAPAPGDAAAR